MPGHSDRFPGSPDLDADRAGEQGHPARRRVWLWRDGWLPAVVVASGGPAVTVRYRLDVGGATGVDTVSWSDLAAAARTVPDQFVG